ncbi:hypothetical protein [Kitasatospora sp. NBC_01539]|uniref:hypothetical protein n=1 Tax=Kitasatospora sp. NBC_01539 TaxID=2903577 RepID=UPI00386008E0
MTRALRRAAVLLAVTGAVCLPAASAVADSDDFNPTIVIGNHNQLAGDDIFNAGQDNTVGSNDGGSDSARAGMLDTDVYASRVVRHYLG